MELMSWAPRGQHYMKSSFPKRVKRHSKNNEFWKRALLICVSTSICLHIYEELFPKTRFLNLALTFESHFFKMALNAFWKRDLHIIPMSVHCHRSVPVLIWPCTLPGRKTPTTRQSLSWCWSNDPIPMLHCLYTQVGLRRFNPPNEPRKANG